MPDVRRLMPQISEISVVFPAPFGPRSARTSPSLDLEADALQRLEARVVDLADVPDGDGG